MKAHGHGVHRIGSAGARFRAVAERRNRMTNDPENSPLNADQVKAIRDSGPRERAREMRAMALADLMREFDAPLDLIGAAFEGMYALGWQDALLFFGSPDATWADGTPFWDGRGGVNRPAG